MNIYTSSELATKTKAVCDDVKRHGCAFVTNNGKADIMMIDMTCFESLNDAIHSYDQWIARTAFESMQMKASSRSMSLDEINAEISAARKVRHKASIS